MARRNPLALALAAVLAPVGAAALPAYEPGVAYIYDNGRVEQVRRVEGRTVTWAARSGRTYSRSVNPVAPILSWSFRGESGVRRVVGDPDGLWPLQPGKQVRFRTVNDLRDEKGRRHARRAFRNGPDPVRSLQRRHNAGAGAHHLALLR